MKKCNFTCLPEQQLRQAADCIRNGGIVAIPTETYYGLAVNPGNEEAVQKIFSIKKRPEVKPVLVLVSRREQLKHLVASIPGQYRQLIDEYWPGPLTLVFEALPHITPLLTANTGTIGVRQTPSPVATRLIDLLGHPITATSANISGYPAAASAKEVQSMFGDSLDMVLDGGQSTQPLPSTVVRIGNEGLCIERKGAVDLTHLLPPCK